MRNNLSFTINNLPFKILHLQFLSRRLIAMVNERRDARVVEEARLESVYTCQRVSRVRIPIPPQKEKAKALIINRLSRLFPFGARHF